MARLSSWFLLHLSFVTVGPNLLTGNRWILSSCLAYAYWRNERINHRNPSLLLCFALSSHTTNRRAFISSSSPSSSSSVQISRKVQNNLFKVLFRCFGKQGLDEKHEEKTEFRKRLRHNVATRWNEDGSFRNRERKKVEKNKIGWKERPEQTFERTSIGLRDEYSRRETSFFFRKRKRSTNGASLERFAKFLQCLIPTPRCSRTSRIFEWLARDLNDDIEIVIKLVLA